MYVNFTAWWGAVCGNFLSSNSNILHCSIVSSVLSAVATRTLCCTSAQFKLKFKQFKSYNKKFRFLWCTNTSCQSAYIQRYIVKKYKFKPCGMWENISCRKAASGSLLLGLVSACTSCHIKGSWPNCWNLYKIFFNIFLTQLVLFFLTKCWSRGPLLSCVSMPSRYCKPQTDDNELNIRAKKN